MHKAAIVILIIVTFIYLSMCGFTLPSYHYNYVSLILRKKWIKLHHFPETHDHDLQQA